MSEQKIDPSQSQTAQDSFAERVFKLRNAIKEVGKHVIALKEHEFFSLPKRETNIEDSKSFIKADQGEMIANIILSYRHLENSGMRLGKVLQAKNGGESILTK